MKAIPGFLFLFFALPAWAGLDFKFNETEMDIPVGEDTIEASFPFKNKGKSPVQVVKIDSSCGCLKASTDKETYAPGESGIVNAVFSVGGQTGKMHKYLNVITNDPDESRQRLTVIVDVPLMFSVEPKMLEWNLGDDPTAKTFTFKVMGKDPVNVEEITSSKNDVSAELKVVEDGRHYEITVTPSATDSTNLGVVTILTDAEQDAQKRQMAFFRIGRTRG